MATPIEHRATFAHAPAEVFAAETDPRALRARLDRLGGTHTELSAHAETDDGVRYTLVQGVPADRLPAAVRKLHSGDLLVRREYTWTVGGAEEGEAYSGSVVVHVGELPGRISARTGVTRSGDESVLWTRGEVVVRIPLVGGKIESFVAEQIRALLAREADLTAQWLAGPR
ncbi:DUF2505 domain-containing protein [Saccharomonospora saliphila]|uniref:DUF2505 domain-containing protein n=1 Tax=Saccharomonospora saliphila TaxID=369829 RepID=UPI0003749589|nr:DUF2505 domain-containing protein [Saccharomonospora saliphila]